MVKMAADDEKQQGHRPGIYKQKNKGHKHGKHRTKGEVERENKGKAASVMENRDSLGWLFGVSLLLGWSWLCNTRVKCPVELRRRMRPVEGRIFN